MAKKIGERIGAVRNADQGTAYLFGFGTYQGDEVPPDDVQGPFGRIGLFGVKNPKLVMDDGTVVWGCESWWGDEARVRKMIGNRRIEFVKPERTPATDAERAEAAEIGAATHKQADDIVAEIVRRQED